jgi:hypothetical protein
VLIELAYPAPIKPRGAFEIVVLFCKEFTKKRLSEYSENEVVRPIFIVDIAPAEFEKAVANLNIALSFRAKYSKSL